MRVEYIPCIWYLTAEGSRYLIWLTKHGTPKWSKGRPPHGPMWDNAAKGRSPLCRFPSGPAKKSL